MDGGYDCEFVDPPTQLQHECSVCLMTLKEPYLTSCCGYSFCRLCIECVRSTDPTCPLCNESDFKTFPNKGLQRSLLQFRVYCQFKKDGCGWIGELRELERHLNINVGPDFDLNTRMSGCLHVEVHCKHGCRKTVPRKELLDHEHNCVYRPYTCEYCQNYEAQINEMSIHWKECGSYPVLCPNKCSEVTFERSRLNQHLNEKCPLISIKCDLCDTELPWQKLEDHKQYHNTSYQAGNMYVTYESYGSESGSGAAVGCDESLDSQLETEIVQKHELEQEIKTDKTQTQLIRKEIDDLSKTYESEIHQLQCEVQRKQQEVDEFQQDICNKEKAITEMQGQKEKALAEEKVVFESEIAQLKCEYQQNIVKFFEKQSASDKEKLECKLRLEKTKHDYEMEMNALTLDLEKKKTALVERESEAFKKDAIINRLKAKIAIKNERKEKNALIKLRDQEINTLRMNIASLRRQLQGYTPSPGKLETERTRHNEDYM